MLVTVLAMLMFIAMLVATFRALRTEIAEARVEVKPDGCRRHG